jgi:ribosomal-protein-serine acetyltransferase
MSSGAMIFSYKVDEEVELVLRDDSWAEVYSLLIENNLEHLRPFSAWISEGVNEEKAKEYLRNYRDAFASGDGVFYLGIVYKGQLAGEIGYNYITKDDKLCTIGYWLGKVFTGKGLVHRSLISLLKDAFDTRRLNKVILEIATDNLESQKVARSLGFINEGTLRQQAWLHDHFTDTRVFGMLKQEYETLKLSGMSRHPKNSHTG